MNCHNKVCGPLSEGLNEILKPQGFDTDMDVYLRAELRGQRKQHEAINLEVLCYTGHIQDQIGNLWGNRRGKGKNLRQ